MGYAGQHIATQLTLHQSQDHGSDISMRDIKRIDLNLLAVLDAQDFDDPNWRA
jgi:hypothetical protein